MLNGKELQVGKSYKTRGFGVVTLINYDQGVAYPWESDFGNTYDIYGKWETNGDDSEYDLLDEYVFDTKEFNPEKNLKEVCDEVKETCKALQAKGSSGVFRIGGLTEFNVVTKPRHYQLFPELNIEVKDVVALLCNRLGTNGYNGAFIADFAQMLQYLMRFDEKNGKEDLEKAKEFLSGMLEKYPDVQQLKGQK